MEEAEQRGFSQPPPSGEPRSGEKGGGGQGGIIGQISHDSELGGKKERAFSACLRMPERAEQEREGRGYLMHNVTANALGADRRMSLKGKDPPVRAFPS